MSSLVTCRPRVPVMEEIYIKRTVPLYYPLVRVVVLERTFMGMGRMFPKFSFLKTIFNDSHTCLGR